MGKNLILLVPALAPVDAASGSTPASAAPCPPNLRTVNCGSYTLCCHWFEVCICPSLTLLTLERGAAPEEEPAGAARAAVALVKDVQYPFSAVDLFAP
jgi:hypothetical protein